MTTTNPERDEAGAYLLDPIIVASECVKNITRYNGGWIRRVDRIDKSKTNGYSLVGEFLKNGLQWMQPGVYVDCSRGGSRKNQRFGYTVFVLKEDGTVTAYNDDQIVVEGPGGDWAVRLWPVIERALEEVAGDRVAILRARKEELLAELARIEDEIRKLESEGTE